MDGPAAKSPDRVRGAAESPSSVICALELPEGAHDCQPHPREFLLQYCRIGSFV